MQNPDRRLAARESRISHGDAVVPGNEQRGYAGAKLLTPANWMWTARNYEVRVATAVPPPVLS
jgi:hypothetical protein